MRGVACENKKETKIKTKETHERSQLNHPTYVLEFQVWVSLLAKKESINQTKPQNKPNHTPSHPLFQILN
jgi:hypothetical protein